jgi:hypothetical protein
MLKVVPFKNRNIDLEKPVRVFRNLTKKRENDLPWYSIIQGDRVVGHAQLLIMVDCRFVVSESGRQRVIREKKKYVHAFIVGRISTRGAMGMLETDDDKLPAKVNYNPYKNAKFFVDNLTSEPFDVAGATAVCINKHGVTAAYLSRGSNR